MLFYDALIEKYHLDKKESIMIIVSDYSIMDGDVRKVQEYVLSFQ